MKFSPIVFFCFLLFFPRLHGERIKVMVYFTDKGPMTLERQSHLRDSLFKSLSPRTLERRKKRGQTPGITYADYPLYRPYVQGLKNSGFQIHHELKWFNAVSGYTDSEAVEALYQFPYVQEVKPVQKYTIQPISYKKTTGRVSTENRLDDEIRVVNALSLKERGLTGKGVIVGIFDTGFNLNHPALDSIREHLIDQYDFVHNDSNVMDDENESGESSHGTITSSIIGGYYLDSTTYFEGLAPGASYLLCKTEYSPTETHLEEDNWAAAAEWAETRGVDIISSSLGYSVFDVGETSYTYEDMDGQTTIVARAANFLTDRGVIVVNSAGNEGNGKWYHITSPGDAPAVITVGAILYSSTYYIASFSSRGPSADGRTKPEVVAPGVGVDAAYYGGGYIQANGTSLSCPIVAGALTLILEAYPNASMGEIRSFLLQAGSNSLIQDVPLEPNNESGWGLPDFEKMYQLMQEGVTHQKQSVSIYPNPASGSNLMVYTNMSLASKSTLTVFNVLGQQIKSISLSIGESTIPFRYPMEEGWPSGIYFIRIENGFQKETVKLIWIK